MHYYHFNFDSPKINYWLGSKQIAALINLHVRIVEHAKTHASAHLHVQ